MNRPKIVLVNRVYPPVRGATGRLLRDLALNLKREGWHVTVVTTGDEASDQRELGVQVIRVKGAAKPRSLIAYLWIWLKLLFVLLKLKRRDVVVSMSDPPLMIYAGYFVAKLKGSAHVNWCHDIYPELLPALEIHYPEIIVKIFRALRRRAMKRSDHVVVCGACMADYLVQDGVDAKQISVVQNWPEYALIDSKASEKTDSKDTPDMMRSYKDQMKGTQCFRVLYSGNIGLAHPVSVILDAAERLQNQERDIEFVFVGDGPRFDYIAQERSERGLDNIRLLPYQPETQLRDVLESGDMHLISMRGEASGLLVPSKLYAAFAVGRPCIFIGPEQSEAAQTIRHFKAGVVVPQGDVEHLMASIILYRKNGDAWYEAYKGALAARDAYMPDRLISSFVSKLRALAQNVEPN